MRTRLVLSCEHAGNKVPERYSGVFKRDSPVLETHRGYDIGAHELARTFGEVCGVEPHLHNVTRLLVDLNRSLNSPSLFSEYVRDFEKEDRKELVQRYYHPHRNRVEESIRDYISDGDRVVHLSVHTFTPVLDGVKRKADIGLLYDPSREGEKLFCREWKEAILEALPEISIRYNYPYKGTMDGFSNYLRERYSDSVYVGLEMEVNQKFPRNLSPDRWKDFQRRLAGSLKETLDS